MEETKATPIQTPPQPPSSVSEALDSPSSPKTTNSKRKISNDQQSIKYRLRNTGKVPVPTALEKKTTRRSKKQTPAQGKDKEQEAKQEQDKEMGKKNESQQMQESKEVKPVLNTLKQQTLILSPPIPPPQHQAQQEQTPQKQDGQPKTLKNEKLRPFNELLTLSTPFYNPQSARSPQQDKTVDGRKTIATFGKPPTNFFNVIQKGQGPPTQQEQKAIQVQEQQQQTQILPQQQKISQHQENLQPPNQQQIQREQEQIKLRDNANGQQELCIETVETRNTVIISPDSVNVTQDNSEILSPPKKKHKPYEKRTMSVAELQKEIQEIKGMLKLTLEFNSFIADELVRTQNTLNKERYLALKKAFVEKEWEDSQTK